jgi:hypothetical protein
MSYRLLEDNRPVCEAGCCVVGHDPDLDGLPGEVHARPMYEVLFGPTCDCDRFRDRCGWEVGGMRWRAHDD